MYSADVIKKLYKELQQCRRQNEKLKEKVKVLESKLEKRENECKNLIEMIELILGNEI
jgi:phage shock protein A